MKGRKIQYKTKALTVDARQFLSTTTVTDLKDIQPWVVGFVEIDGRGVMTINTTKGEITLDVGTWILKRPDGSLTFMSPDTFDALFETVPA